MSRPNGSRAVALKTGLARELSRHPRVVANVAELGRRAGATKLAERLERAGGVVVFTPPSPGATRLRLLMFGGTDQIAEAFRDEGWHAFEAPLPDVFAAIVRRRPGLVLDVGANSGFYALLAASVAPGVEVHAFEPFPPAIDALWSNIRLNGAESVVTVVDKAVGDEPGFAQLFVPDAGHGRRRARLRPAVRPRRRTRPARDLGFAQLRVQRDPRGCRNRRDHPPRRPPGCLR